MNGTNIWLALLGSPVIVIAIQEIIKRIFDKKKDEAKKIENDLLDIKRDLIRVQLLNLIQHDPKNKLAINDLYDKYKNPPFNGNSYIKDIYNKWAKR